MSKKEIYQVTFECEVITPMFLGNANPREAELRPPSIKGAMRFWWRAMNAGLPLAELKRKESEIFGGVPENESKEDEKIGKSKVLIRVMNKAVNFSNQTFQLYPTIITNQGYKLDSLVFMGYGKGLPPSKKQGRPNNEWSQYIVPKSVFEITFISLDIDLIQEHVKTFRVLEYFGGVGGKSRNGFGSFKIHSMKIKGEGLKIPDFSPTSLFNLSKLPSFPAFSNKAKLIKGKNENSSWHEAMNDLAIAYYSAKSQLVKTDKIPESNTFGNKKEFVGMLLKDTSIKLKEKPNRIPKPYFMKIDQTNSGKYLWRILYLPSKFLEGIKTEENSRLIEKVQSEFLAYLELMICDFNKPKEGDTK